MKPLVRIAALFAALLLASSSVLAHGGRARVGVGLYMSPWGFWGPPVYSSSYYYPRPYYPYPDVYYPRTVVVQPSAPMVYIEQGDGAGESAPAGGNYWHYCKESGNYYPYVKECPGGWHKVSPEPEK